MAFVDEFFDGDIPERNRSIACEIERPLNSPVTLAVRRFLRFRLLAQGMNRLRDHLIGGLEAAFPNFFSRSRSVSGFK